MLALSFFGYIIIHFVIHLILAVILVDLPFVFKVPRNNVDLACLNQVIWAEQRLSKMTSSTNLT